MKLLPFTIIFFVGVGCHKKLDVESNEVALIIKYGKPQKVLNGGEYMIDYNAYPIFYKVTNDQIDFDFDILFSDATKAFVKFNMSYKPIIDSLPQFYNSYETDLFKVVVEIETKSEIRELLINYDSVEFSNESLRDSIINVVMNSKLSNYINIQRVDSLTVYH